MNFNKSSLSPSQLRLISVSHSESAEISNNSELPVSALDRSFSLKVASNLFVSFKYAWTGITYAFKTQRNFRIHTVIGTLAISLGIFLHLTSVEIAIIGLTVGAVMAMELLNTAIESVVDLSVGQSYHELAKIAKDCAAGAVMIFALAAVLVAGVLLLPPLFVLLQSLTLGV